MSSLSLSKASLKIFILWPSRILLIFEVIGPEFLKIYRFGVKNLFLKPIGEVVVGVNEKFA